MPTLGSARKMPARARKRKPKRRRPSSRKKARRRRPPSRPRVNPPSSDEDFVLDGNGDESSSGSTDQEDNEEAEDTEEEEEEEESEDEEEKSGNEVRNSDANVGFSARRRRQPTRALSGLVNATSLSGSQRLEEYSVLEGDGTGKHASRVRRQNRRQESSDEDFEVDMERILENSSTANEGVVASRPMTRAMDQVSDLGERGQLSDSLVQETRGFTVNLNALQSGAGGTSLQIRNPQDGHANFVRRGSSVINSAEIAKRKGKEKALEAEESSANVADEESTAVVCGICWTEMVVVERGKLDSCNHFFCFGCIMEWAKVESRCPMCKQRFTTIARSGTGFSKRMRTIRIPLRNQVYIPPEDPDLPLEDPYGDIVCMECQGTGDEGLLLLCDRCDSAAHTFCVGLGRSVPRGDWYCRDCQALTGGMSGSEDEPEELGLASGGDDDDDEEEEDDDDAESENDDTDSLLRSIVAAVDPGSQRTRQARVQRRSTSTPSSLPLPRNVRSRLWRRLSHRQRGRYIAAPRLSQTARALLSSTLSELNQTPHTPEASQNGSARTVPQQRRLHERINEMRINWGRIQNGDLHFDALGIGATGPMQQAVSSNSNGAASRAGATGPAQVAISSHSNIAPIATTSSIMSSVSDKKDVDFVERPESTQGEKDVERAWRMMGHAQNLTAGIGSSKSHQQKLGASPSSSVSARATQPTVNTTSSATSNLISARKNLEIPTCNVPSPPLKNGNAGIYKPGSTSVQVFPTLKHDEIPLRQVPRPIVPLASTGECRKEDLPSSSNSKQTLTACKSPIGFDKDSSRPAGGKHTVNFVIPQGFKPDLSNSGRQFQRKDAGITHTVTDYTRTKDSRDVSAARENIVAGSLSSPPHEGLKVHLTELVKRQTWPVYITERLDKEQFKRIARAAVHSLLALCDPNNKSMSLSCVHFEDQGNDPVVKCCNKCLDQHVEKAVKNAKDKIIPS